MKIHNLQVYIEPRKRKPRPIDMTMLSGNVPSTIVVDGTTYHWSGSDFVDNVVLYTEVEPTG